MILQDGSLLKAIIFEPDPDGGCETCQVGRGPVVKIVLLMLGNTPWGVVWYQNGDPPTCYNLTRVKAVEVL